LSLTKDEREAKNKVELPYEHRGNNIDDALIYLDEDDDAFTDFASDPDDELDL